MKLSHLVTTTIAALAFSLTVTPSYAVFFDPSQPPSTFYITNQTDLVITAVSLKEPECFPTSNSTDPQVIRAATRKTESLYWKTRIGREKRAALTVYGKCWASEVLLWSNGRLIATISNQLVSNIKTVALKRKGKKVLAYVTARQHKVDLQHDLGRSS